jgi:hypothetical protein
MPIWSRRFRLTPRSISAYQLHPNVQLFAWARNVTNSWYYNFGTFSPTSSVAISQAPGATATPG